MFRLYVVAFACLLALLVSCTRQTEEAHSSVVLYCSVDQEIAEPVIAEFEKQTGIRVLARYDNEASKTVGLIQKLRSEAANPAADVFWSNEIFYTIRLAREGVIAEYPFSQAAAWPALLRGEKGRWYGLALRARVIAYDTRRVAPEEAPKKLEDLLDPKWKGRIVMASPEFGTTGGDVASWFAHYGPEKARAILEGLAANDVRLVDANSTAVRTVASGQADIALTDTDDVYAAQRNNWPIAMNYLDQGGDGVLVIPNTVALVAGAPHPEAAARLMEFLLSERVEEMLVRSDSHNTPVHPSLAKQFLQYQIPKRLEIDYGKIADELPAAISTAREILH